MNESRYTFNWGTNMDKRKITENLICESFKNMLLKYPFEKITIKRITDEAGIIRPTFYNYFQDKYELLERYLKNDIMDSADNLIENNMDQEAVKLIFIRFEKNKAFYRKAFEVKGQNSFESILHDNIQEIFKKIFIHHEYTPEKSLGLFDLDNISKYYTNGLIFIIKSWLDNDYDTSVDKLIEGYFYLMTHSTADILGEPVRNHDKGSHL